MSSALRKLTRALVDLALILAAVGVVFVLTQWLVAAWPLINEPRYIRENLDTAAVRPGELKLSGHGYVGIKYRDTDGDGDFDSILLWKNAEGYTVDIAVRKTSSEQLQYPTIEPDAIVPHEALARGIQVDYRWKDRALRAYVTAKVPAVD